jgi:hypothetical protein
MEWLMGLHQKIAFDFRLMLCNNKVNGYFTNTNQSKGRYVEFTPYNKGNLYKIRYYRDGYLKVFYGTKELAYCTTIKDCLQIIQPKQIENVNVCGKNTETH